jgi:hypothetical protein
MSQTGAHWGMTRNWIANHLDATAENFNFELWNHISPLTIVLRASHSNERNGRPLEKKRKRKNEWWMRLRNKNLNPEPQMIL